MTSSSHNQTPSASASTSHPSTWDVFLSFRGRDTRDTFTGHLYYALSRIKIRTFKDDPELRSGEVIRDALLQAIQESETYVVVFSENYASSSWCLDELVEILRCHKSMGRLVIPVFFNIDPYVVRHRTKNFGEALHNHQFRYGVETEKVINWHRTLTEVANFSGEHIHEKRSEADILSKVVDRILGELNPKILDVTKYPVGLDSRVRDITAKMISDTQRVTKIGIYGMGGVGKTTLAKAVYNQNYRRFDGSSFLANVREESRTEQGLLCLQQQLIDNVLKCSNQKIDNVHHGITYIKRRLCSFKVLIVIDDLDDPKPLEYLGQLASGSIIIITTRNEDLLDSVEVEARYKVSELDYAESLQLFTKHAFGDKIISDSLMKFFDKILERAGGLPLALKVFGSNLINRSDEGYWRWFVDESIKVSITKVEEDLLISFHGLKSGHPMLQDIFLDIACFFMGQEEEEVVKIMETCYISVNRYIDILKKRCLLTINDRDELGMHHLLRDMGREIARNNSPCEPGKHSRLWVLDDICNVLKKNKGTKAIEGIIPHNLEYQNALDGLTFATKTFKKMHKLRFLYLEKVDLTGSFQQAFDFLRLFRWKSCPLKCLPSEFYPDKLVILELPYSKMTTMWEPNMVSPVFKELKILNMSYSLDLNTTPDFTKLPCLEILNLEGCKSLVEIHIPIESLVGLVSLNLCYCENLRSLPDTITNLTALEVLSIDHCGSLKVLPEELGKIESLKKLNAKELTVSKIPDSIGNLSQLVELRLSSNEDLETLPDTIFNLVSLEILDISRCKKLRVTGSRDQDASVANLLKLPDTESSQYWPLNQENIDLKDCHRLLYIAKFPPNLKQIKADGCTSLESLPNLSNLKHLENLDLTDCKCLAEIHGLEELTSIRKIQLAGCNSSLLASIFTKRLFQLFSEMGNQIEIYIRSDMFPDWISQESTMSIDLSSDKFLGMILCFKYLGEFAMIDYSIKTTSTTSEFIWRDSINTPDIYESLMVILPRSIFSVRDADHRIELTTENAEIYGIHLLYKREITTINLCNNTSVSVEKERGYPSKRLKR